MGARLGAVSCALVLLGLAVLAAPSPVRAQVPTIVVLPEDAPPDVRDAIRIELQLAGRRVLLMTAARRDPDALRELAAHAEAEVIAWLEDGRGPALVRVGPDRTWREPVESGSMRSPRAVALLASALLELEPDPPSPRVRVPRVRPVFAEPAATLLAAPAAATSATPRRARVLPSAPAALPPVLERVGLEVLGAALLGGALALGGALVGDFAAQGDPFPFWALGLTLGGTVGSAAGALLAGRLTGADGDPFWTLFAGFLGGGVAGLLLWVGDATDTDPDDGVTTGWVYLGAALTVVLPPALAILAFELSVPAEQSPRLRVELGPHGVRGTF